MQHTQSTHTRANAIPARAGIGLRAPHIAEVINFKPDVSWFEVHSENYFGSGIALQQLEQVRGNYPISLHGVGLSLGSTDELNIGHLKKLKTLIAQIDPGLVSEHLSWGSIGQHYLNDLLPLPYTEEELAHVISRVTQVQDYLKRQILIENISSYLEFSDSTYPEWEFVRELGQQSGCAILLDINNIYVSSFNHNFDPLEYVNHIPVDRVVQFHIAGHENCGDYIIDTHDAPVVDPVWKLYAAAVSRFGAVSTMIEGDDNIPALEELLHELNHAREIASSNLHVAAA